MFKAHQTIHHRFERLKNIKIGVKIGDEISVKNGVKNSPIRSKVNDVGVTQPDYHRL